MPGLEPRRLVLRLPNWVGDVAMSTSVVRACLAQSPETDLHVVGRGSLSALCRGLLPGDSCHSLDWLRGRPPGFPLGVLLTDSFSSAWEFWSAGIPSLGRSAQLRGLLLRHRRPARHPGSGLHMVEEWEALLAPLGFQPSRFEPCIALNPEERAVGAAALARLHPGPTTVALCPGAAFGGAKRWPPELFAQLARSLAREGHGAVLVGSAAERGLLEEISRDCAAPVAPALALREWAALLAAAQVVVANDSGAAHVAAAVAAPVVALFGPTDPGWSRPRSARTTVLRNPLECSPCHQRECPLIHHRCLRDLPVARVVQAVEAHLRKGDPQP